VARLARLCEQHIARTIFKQAQSIKYVHLYGRRANARQVRHGYWATVSTHTRAHMLHGCAAGAGKCQSYYRVTRVCPSATIAHITIAYKLTTFEHGLHVGLCRERSVYINKSETSQGAQQGIKNKYAVRLTNGMLKW
jgi:hypothetical protein